MRRDYETFWISALEVHFAHDSVNEYFTDFIDMKGRKRTNVSILDTVHELVNQKIPEELDVIPVVWLEDGANSRWTVAGTFNRRLVVFRLLTIFLPDQFRRMRVRKVPRETVNWYLRDGRSKLSTRCHGVYVEVRPGRYVGTGHAPKGEDKYGVRWGAAVQLFNKVKG